MQVFSQPIYDKVAKYILKQDEGFRNYILSALIGLKVESSQVIDDHLYPFDKYQALRHLVNSEELEKAFSSLLDQEITKAPALNPLLELAHHYEDLKRNFPLPDRNSQVDLICETYAGYILVEFQIVQQKYWDDRALAYVAAVYGRQLRYGQRWEDESLQKVIGVNLLGKGTVPYWGGKEYVRHYRMVNHATGRTLNQLQLIQYSLGDVSWDHPDFHTNKALRDTLEFFKEAHHKEVIPEDIDEHLKKGYDLINVEKLKHEAPSLFEDQQKFFDNLQTHDDAVKAMGLEEGKAMGLEEGKAMGLEEGERRAKVAMAKALREEGLSWSRIAVLTQLSVEELEDLNS